MGNTVRVGIAAVAAMSMLSLVGCSDPDPPSKSLTASSFLGGTMGQAFAQLGYNPNGQPPGDLGVLTYNVTPAVSADRPPGVPGLDWVVIASCYTDAPIPNGIEPRSPRIALGAIPAKYATDAVKTQARQRIYDRTLSECPGTSDMFTVIE